MSQAATGWYSNSHGLVEGGNIREKNAFAKVTSSGALRKFVSRFTPLPSHSVVMNSAASRNRVTSAFLNR